MSEILGFNVPIDFGNMGGIASNTFGVVMNIMGGLIILGLMYYFYYIYLLYNKKINIFENLGGNQYRLVGKDRAKLMKIGDSGEEVLKLRKRKKILSAYGKKMGKNEYWFAVGQDGYWYNITLGDLDAKKGMLDIEPVERDVRYAQVAIRRNIIDRYRKVSFMDKYGSWIIGGATIIILMVGVYFLLDKMGENAAANAGAMQTSERVLTKIETLLSTMDNVCSSSSSGLKPVQVIS